MPTQTGQAPVTANPFSDVSESDWFYDFVIYALENGIFSGISAETFQPEGTMTRGMFVAVMGRISGHDMSDYVDSAGASDVAANAWYAPYVAWAVEMGITDGTGDGTFSPDLPIDREQMAVMLLHYYEAYDIDYGESDTATQPADLQGVSPWAREAVLKLWRAGIFQGDTAGNFNPKANATRAECAAISTRADKIVTAFYEENREDEKDNSNDVHSDTYYVVSFNTNGGTLAARERVMPGKTLSKLPVTQKDSATFLGWYTNSVCTIPFYASEPINNNMTLYAKFAEQEKNEQFLDDTFSLVDQTSSLSFIIYSADINMTVETVKSMLLLEAVDHSGTVSLKVEKNLENDGTYIVFADGGFKEGSSYKLTLGDLLTFEGKAESYRMCTFTIEKEEVMNLSLSNDLIYIPGSELSDIVRNTEYVDALSVALMGNIGTISGSFTYKDASQLEDDDLLCVYTGVSPKDRDTETDYSDSEIAYVQVSSVSGTTVNYTGIDETDAQDVLYLPDTLPIDTAELAADEDLIDHEFTIADTYLDFSEYATLGLDVNTTVDAGDFLVFFTKSFAAGASSSYGKVTNVVSSGGSTTVTFTDTTADAIQNTNLDYYTKDDVSGKAMLKNVDKDAIEDQIEKQAVESGFDELAMSYLANVATQTDGFKKISGVESFVFADESGSAVDPGKIALMSSGFEGENDNVTVTAEISPNTENFGRGLRCALTLSGAFFLDVGDGSKVKIYLSATFVEEVKMSFNANGGAIWDRWGIFPYIRDYQMSANVDVYNFTGISLQAKISSAEKGDVSNLIDFTELDVSEELKKLLGVEDEAALDAGVQELFELYGEMLETETDYISIVDKEIVKQQAWVDPFCIIAYSFQVDFVISANINVWLGTNFEYMNGTRYNFWFEVMAKKAGSSSMDLMDATYEFQFYVVGTIGLRAGLEFEFAVGLFSTDLNSIGLSVECGAYVELYGYFIYELKSSGLANDKMTTDMVGALYIEFGIYLEIKFKAQVGNDKFKYNPTLSESKWPLLYAGTQLNVYDFGYEKPDDDEAVIIENDDEYPIPTLTLPESYRSMARLDLKEGDLSTAVYSPDKFYYSITNKNFNFDASTGQITVTVPKGVQYMECDLTLTWKSDKLAFTNSDLARTIHLVWTNLTADQLKEKYTVSVKAGNDIDGYTTVWSTRVNKGVLPELPEESEILKLIGYGKNTGIVDSQAVDLRYASYTGYKGGEPAEIVNGDQVYIFEAAPRKYTLTVSGVQKPDGATYNQTFTAKFSESFDLSALTQTGTRAFENATYTRYLTTECTDDKGAATQTGKAADSIINTDFATQLLAGTYTYNALYTDNSCNVTYSFKSDDGIAIDPVTVKLEKGSIPAFDYSTYLLNQGVGYIALSWDHPIGKVTGDTLFNAVCGTPEGDPCTITFDTMCGSEVPPMSRYTGAAISAPTEPIQVGYTFTGWFTDDALTSEYAFSFMPAESFTLYAKWTPNQYTVTFNAGAGVCDTPSKNVTYGGLYDTLPVPTRIGYGFNGWYTSDAYAVSESTNVFILQNHTLFADWYEKQNVTGLVTTPQTYTYDETAKAFALSGTDLTGFTVQYMNFGADSYSAYAVNASTYIVQITRPEDATHNPFSLTLNGALIINKAVRNVTVDPPTYKSNTFSTITVNPVAVPDNDGTMMYVAGTSSTPPASGWTTSSTISGLAQNTTYYVFAEVDGGENYLDAISTGVIMQTGAKAATSVGTSWYIKTGSDTGAGTDGEVYGKVLFVDGTETGNTSFATSGENDFQNEDYDQYGLNISRDPWMISGITIGKEDGGTKWQCSYIDFGVSGYQDNRFDVDSWIDDGEVDRNSTAFQRRIASAGSFDQWGGVFDLDSSSTGTIAFSYDGTVTQQAYGAALDPQYATYNAYIRDDAPTISVTPSSTKYGHCYAYSNYDFTVNEAALYAKMSACGDDQISFTITLDFPIRSTTAATATITKTLTIRR